LQKFGEVLLHCILNAEFKLLVSKYAARGGVGRDEELIFAQRKKGKQPNRGTNRKEKILGGQNDLDDDEDSKNFLDSMWLSRIPVYKQTASVVERIARTASQPERE
jgi:hypothetical protein